MRHEDETEAHFLVRKLLTAEQPTSASAHPWISEDDRWIELVFSVLSRVAHDVPEREVRRAINRLANLGLLAIRDLASTSDVRSQRIGILLREHGFKESEATRGLTLVSALASGFQKQFGGKVQLYLRHHGEMMLDDVDKLFDVPSSDRSALASAYTYWLQNALSMPLSLVDQTMWTFCEKNGVTPEELIAAADDLNINIAFLDDLIHES